MNCTATHTAATVKTHAGAGKQILVVDDDPGVISMTVAMLQSDGYTTLAAPSGEQGVELYRNAKTSDSPVDLVLLDLTLPGGISGIETLDEILSLDPSALVIATSGFFEEDAAAGAAHAARQRGFRGILPKPYSSERLLELVRVSISSVA